MLVVARILVLLLAFGSAVPAMATADSTGITISPAQKELILGSGLIEATTEVVITNNTGKNLDATVRAVDFKTLNDTAGLTFAQAGVPTEKYSLANWMSLPNGDQLTLANGQATTIPVHVVNRADLAPGGHYGAVVVSVSTAGSNGASRAGFRQEFVSLLFVKKLGGEKYGLSLESLTADRKRLIPDSATLNFSSTGNVHVVPRGYVTVSDARGTVFAKGTINPDSTMLLPGTRRSMITLLQPVASTKTSAGLTLTAYYRYDEQSRFETRSIVLSPPRSQVLLAVGAVATGLIATAGIWILRRKTHKLGRRQGR